MAIFSKTTTNKIKTTKTPVALKDSVKTRDGRLENIIRAPWLSEKALIATEAGVYVFEVPASATKPQVMDAIELIYKVRPRKTLGLNLHP